MKTSNAVLTGLAVAVIVAGLAWAIDVDVSGETELPNVDVEMTEGELPEVDVEAVDVDVTRGEKTVTIPYPEVDVERDPGAQDGVAQEDDLEKMNDGVDNPDAMDEPDMNDGETEAEDNDLTY